MPVSDEHMFFFGRHTLDLRRGCLSRDGHEIELRPKSFAVLRYLVENAGRLIAKDELIAAIWADVSVTDASLARCVSDVRLALADREQRIVKTVPRRGYLLTELVTSATDEPYAASASDELPPRHQQAERRQLSVMACELISLPTAAPRQDLEDLRHTAAALRQRCTEIVEQHHGMVAGFAGDCLTAYFGYPEAREEDAENSVRTALALQQIAISPGAETGVRLRPCVGIASGIVAIGDERVGGTQTEPAAVGEVPVLAARLQALAEPGQIIVAQSTRRLAGGLFEYGDLRLMSFKGVAAPVEVSRVLGDSGVESRFEAHRPTLRTPLVGREEEIELLQRRWQQAKTGDGSIVLLAGEPGIGKSRIAEAALESLAGETYTALRLFCSSHRQHSALYPIILQLERAAGFRRTDSDEERLIKLQRMLARIDANSCAGVPLLAELLSIPTAGRYPPLKLASRQQKEATLDALLSHIRALSASRPLVMIVEDVHWADPTSIELIDLVVEQAPHLRLLLIVTYRPEFSPPWIGRSQTNLITLGRLPPRQCEAMVSAVVHDKPLPKSLLDEIVERTDGVPLFIEELTKAVIESGAVTDAGDHYTVAVPSRALEIPVTLHASLLARLDRLGVARGVAQIGAALGRRFAYQLISAVSAMPQRTLDDALARLEGAGLIWRRGRPPDAEYTFKHALVQDAAYGTLLRDARCTLHARIAETLESRFSDISESQPELLAHHYTEAGQIEGAASWWGKAGQRSLTRSALQEAAAQLARALEQIETLPSTTAWRREQIKLQLALANALMHTKGYSAPETNAALDRVRALAERAQAFGEPLEDPLLLFSVLHGFWVANHVAFNGDAIVTLAEQFLGLAEKQEASFPFVLGHRLMGTSLLYLGDIEGGRAHLDKALAYYDPAEHRPLVAAARPGRWGGDPVESPPGSMAPGLSGRGTTGCRRRAEECP